LGAAEDEVSSPTFTIIQEYSGEDLKLYHVDLYRLESKEVDDLGLDDLASDGGIVAIEWAGRWEDRPVDAIEVTLHDEGGDRRRIVVRRPDPHK
jgi:tRNA threonylcarbamoyladenosine biosynthesis protein TsaE